MVALWLLEKARDSQNTAVAYRKDVERFLFFLANEKKVVSDATREDYVRYAYFLKSPSPAFVAQRKFPRTSSKWRPFTSGLSDKSVSQSLSIVRSLIQWMHSNGWLMANAMPEVKHLVKVTREEPAQRVARRQLSEQQMGLLERYALQIGSRNSSLDSENMMKASGVKAGNRRDRVCKARFRLILALAGTLAARQADICEGFLSDFSPSPEGFQGAQWLWYIPNGKGRKASTLPVPDWIMGRVSDLRVALGLPALPEPGEPPCPILPDIRFISDSKRVDLSKPVPAVSRSGFYRFMQKAFKETATLIARGELDGSNADVGMLKGASTHYLRHTAIKRITNKTSDLTVAKILARHASIETTAIYAESTLQDLAKVIGS
jgi:site-specific recombinase XerD